MRLGVALPIKLIVLITLLGSRLFGLGFPFVDLVQPSDHKPETVLEDVAAKIKEDPGPEIEPLDLSQAKELIKKLGGDPEFYDELDFKPEVLDGILFSVQSDNTISSVSILNNSDPNRVLTRLEGFLLFYTVDRGVRSWSHSDIEAPIVLRTKARRRRDYVPKINYLAPKVVLKDVSRTQFSSRILDDWFEMGVLTPSKSSGELFIFPNDVLKNIHAFLLLGKLLESYGAPVGPPNSYLFSEIPYLDSISRSRLYVVNQFLDLSEQGFMTRLSDGLTLRDAVTLSNLYLQWKDSYIAKIPHQDKDELELLRSLPYRIILKVTDNQVAANEAVMQFISQGIQAELVSFPKYNVYRVEEGNYKYFQDANAVLKEYKKTGLAKSGYVFKRFYPR